MPSLRDLTDADLGDEISIVEATPAPGDVLARVKAEGMRRRLRRRRRNGALAVLGIAALAVPAAALLPGDDPEESVTVASEGAEGSDADSEPARPSTTDAPVAGSQSPTTPTSLGSATTVPSVVVPGPDPETELGPAVSIERPLPPPTTVPPQTTVPAPSCVNSTDPACGPFRWDPAPGPNGELTASIAAPATAAVGEQVTFEVTWSDPDATLTFDHFSADGVGLARSCAVEPRYGPWTPPAATAGSGALSYTHAFGAPGTYTVVVSLGTGECANPYGSDRTAEVTVVVG